MISNVLIMNCYFYKYKIHQYWRYRNENRQRKLTIVGTELHQLLHLAIKLLGTGYVVQTQSHFQNRFSVGTVNVCPMHIDNTCHTIHQHYSWAIYFQIMIYRTEASANQSNFHPGTVLFNRLNSRPMVESFKRNIFLATAMKGGAFVWLKQLGIRDKIYKITRAYTLFKVS